MEDREESSMISLYHESGIAVARTVRIELGTSSISKESSLELVS